MFSVTIRAKMNRLPQLITFQQRCPQSVTKISKSSQTIQPEKCMPLNTPGLLSTSVTETQAASVINDALRRKEPIPVLGATGGEMSAEVFETSAKLSPRFSVEKTTLPFEEIPGPAILKLWEKYWKYVPLLGTQLFCSLLINRFTQGRLSWNRNVTPMKYLFNEYGSIVRINGPLVGDIVMIHRPEHIAEVLNQERGAPIRSGIDVLQHYRLNHRKYRFAGPFSLQGAEWLELRKKVESSFRETSTGLVNNVNMVSDELISRIRNTRNRQDEVPSNFHEELTRWSVECFCTLVFNKHVGFLDASGYNPTSEAARIIDALTTAHVYLTRCETGFQIWRFFNTPFCKKLFEACDILDGIVGKYIRQAQKLLGNKLTISDKRTNLFAEDSSPVIEKLLIDDQIQPDDISTLLMDMIILGAQAVANCEAFLLYFLAKNPRAQRKLYNEIISVQKDGVSSFTQDNLRNMPYLKACLRESLRLRPAFPYITRLLTKTITLHGYTVPKGTFVIMANQITSQREENFEDPEKFLPERWLTDHAQEGFHSSYSYLPFGRDIRACLGQNIAEAEMMILTSRLIQQFKVEYDYADIGPKFMMLNTPNKPLRFRFVDRR